MRVEDVGSLSPSGDLLAFMLALIITVGVVSSFYTTENDVHDGCDPAFVFKHLIKWEALDQDGDGYLEQPDPARINGSYISSLVEHRLEVFLLSDNFTLFFKIEQGVAESYPENTVMESVIHSWVISFESDDLILPGRLSISCMEAST